MNARLNDSDAPFGESHGPLLTGAFAPVFEELVLDALPVDGEIPADLNGVYLRNGPNPRFEPNGTYHPFDGDGMIHGAHFDRGRVTYRNKWVRTDALQEEQRAGASPFWGIMGTLKGRSDRRLKDTANTDVIAHGGQAVASWYLAGTPYLIDPITLETVRKADYVRAPGNGVSAHPKVDEHTGELCYFDYGHEHPFMWYGVVDAAGRLVHHVPVELPGLASAARHGDHRALLDPARPAGVQRRRGLARRAPQDPLRLGAAGALRRDPALRATFGYPLVRVLAVLPVPRGERVGGRRRDRDGGLPLPAGAHGRRHDRRRAHRAHDRAPDDGRAAVALSHEPEDRRYRARSA